MISFDLECSNGHRFEGIFKDYQTYDEQLNKKLISCPICNNDSIKRLYTGCSIKSNSSKEAVINKDQLNLSKSDLIKIYIKGVNSEMFLQKNDVVLVSRGLGPGSFRAMPFLLDKDNIIASSTVYIIRITNEKILPTPDRFAALCGSHSRLLVAHL